MSEKRHEVEFVGGPFQGKQRFPTTADKMPRRISLPLGEDRKPHRGKGQPWGFVEYERREEGGVFRYHFTGRMAPFVPALASRQIETIRKSQEQSQIEAIRKWLGRRVVVTFRKGGRIREERSYDSDSDNVEDLLAIRRTIGLFYPHTPIGPELIGKGFTGLLPWQSSQDVDPNDPKQRFEATCPVRVADVAENEQTGVTRIFMESV
jgi:hypothetical protein